ncbi:MAG: NADH-quinone oxidoreductase subunit M, partial [Caulobacterales bacterium]|nr:NADH-quinone oxidoreductase subunit M [Caulobacterales bacterium]
MNAGEAPILSAITFTPLAGALILMFFRALARSEDAPRIAENARWLALFVTLFTLALTIFMLSQFVPGEPGFQFVEEAAWLGGGISYRMGVDGISVLFVLLTAFLMPLCIVASWSSIEERVAEYMIAFLILETLMIGTFCALDLILFYLFFEGGLIPMFIIIGVWGGANRIYAAFKFFLYTLAGSLLMLVAIIAIYLQTGTTDIAA